MLFIKFSLISRVHQTKLSPLEARGRARPRSPPRPPPYGAVERSARSCQWSPESCHSALQAGPVLILQFHPSPRTPGRGREGLLTGMHVLEAHDDDLGVDSPLSLVAIIAMSVQQVRILFKFASHVRCKLVTIFRSRSRAARLGPSAPSRQPQSDLRVRTGSKVGAVCWLCLFTCCFFPPFPLGGI